MSLFNTINIAKASKAELLQEQERLKKLIKNAKSNSNISFVVSSTLATISLGAAYFYPPCAIPGFVCSMACFANSPSALEIGIAENSLAAINNELIKRVNSIWTLFGLLS